MPWHPNHLYFTITYKYFTTFIDTDEVMSLFALPWKHLVVECHTTIFKFAYVEHINEQPNYAHDGKKKKHNHSFWELVHNQDTCYITRSDVLFNDNF